VIAPPLGRFYPIVDVARVPAPGALALAEAVVAAGARWVQLRCKDIPSGPVLALAREVVGLAARGGARVIVNDRPDLAVLAGAAGVHVGQDDLPLPAVRRIAPGLVVGVSTHDVAQARRAEAEGADYVGFGPMYATGSKADALSPRTSAELRLVRAAIAIPIVAIGGIDEATAADVLAAGADAVAMIGALARSRDPRALTARLLALR